MVRVEIDDEINASPKRIYDILTDDNLETKWNLTVDENINIGENRWKVKSTIGDLTSHRVEAVENEKVSFDIEGSIFNKMGYILNPKGEHTHATLWGEFDDEKNTKILKSAGGVLLDSLKRFAEFLEEGGNPDEFDKKILKPLTP